MTKVETETGQMITALRDGLHGLHLARMALVCEAKALRLAGRRTERDRVWSRVEEITAQIEATTRELAEHMLREEETQRRRDAETRWVELLPCPFCGAKAKTKQHEPSMPELPNGWWTVECSHATQYHHKRGKGCPVMPMAVGDTIEEATARWNTRTAYLPDGRASGRGTEGGAE